MRSRVPAAARVARFASGGDTPREFLERAVFVIGAEKDAAVGEVPLPEGIERIELGDASRPDLDIARIDWCRAHIAEGENVGGAAIARGLECFLVFPFGPGHRGTAVDATVFARRGLIGERSAEPRPQDQHDDVERAGRLDGILGVRFAGGYSHDDGFIDNVEPSYILKKPLLIEDQGSFFIGGHHVKSDTLSTLPAYAPSGTITGRGSEDMPSFQAMTP